ncbi:LCP family protein [Paenibacillus tarimensis]
MNKRKYKWAAVIAAVIIIAGTAGYMNRMHIALWGFNTFISDDIEKQLEKSYKPFEGREVKPIIHEETIRPISLLLLGVDQRKNERGRSDTMIYTVIRPEDGAMLMVSIPRDAYVEIPGRSRADKITHAYAFGEAKLAVETVENLFGLPVDHYAAINFEGFRSIIDEMGGIALPIEKDLVNDDPNHEKFVVKAGQDLYNGQDALNYVRYREDAGGDLTRTGRHQVFISAMLDKASEVGQWTKIPQLVDIMGSNFTTDIVPNDLIDMAKTMLQSGHRTIYSHTLKGKGGISSDNGIWYYYLDKEDLDKAKAWIQNWLDASKSRAELPLPDQYKQNPIGAGMASEVVRP